MPHLAGRVALGQIIEPPKSAAVHAQTRVVSVTRIRLADESLLTEKALRKGSDSTGPPYHDEEPAVFDTDQYFDAREMQMVHRMFRREFHLAPGLVRRVLEGDSERAETVVGHLEFMANILHTHHSFEDHRVWPALVD